MATGTQTINTSSYNTIAHLKASIRDILRTPMGSRAMRRSYGSRLFYLIGQPMNEFLVAKIQMTVTDALARFEPRYQLTQVVLNSVTPEGKVILDLDGYWIPNQQRVALQGFEV